MYTPVLPEGLFSILAYARSGGHVGSLVEPPNSNREHTMPLRHVQLWKGSTFTIECKKGKAPGTVIFHLSGPFTARDMFGVLSPEAMRNLFESQLDEPPAIHIFDLTDVPYMDSWGLGMIMSQYVRCQAKGLRMVAAGVSPRVLEWFRLTKLDALIPMDATVEEAEAHALISPQPRPLHPDVLRFLGEGI